MNQEASAPKTPRWKILNKDGSFNLRRKGPKKFPISDLYHYFLSASWGEFFLWVFILYMAINVEFATAYFFCGPDALGGIRDGTRLDRFVDCFFFSVQTIATIGYGRISPVNLIANILVTLEALLGMLCLATVTGLFYARFARPTSRILFSRPALITTLDGEKVLMMRIANERLNQIAEAKVGLSLVRTEVSKEGESFRKIYSLKLERDYSPVFALTWTLIHPIDAGSPFYQATLEDLERVGTEIFVSVSGVDETFSQNIHARYSYTPEDLVWGGRFKDIVHRQDDGKVLVDLQELHTLEKDTALNPAGTP